MTKDFRICVIPGDGIGPEVVDCSIRVLESLGGSAGPSFTFDEHQAGHGAFLDSGEPLPETTLEAAKAADCVLVGAMDVAQIPSHARPPLGVLRRELEVGASVRPARSYVGAPNVRDDMDVLVVREVTEGFYSHIEYPAGREAACAVRLVTRKASGRTAKIAFEQAAERRGMVTAIHKRGALPLTDGLFLDTVAEVAESYPDVAWNSRNVDACAMELIRHPQDFDVILTTNSFGDILSDVGAGLAGGLGLAPSGCVGERWAYFEPVHGSAPDIAGKGIANPMATVLSAAMMLRHLGEVEMANAVERAVSDVLESGTVRTGDLGGSATSAEVTDAIIDAMGASA